MICHVMGHLCVLALVNSGAFSNLGDHSASTAQIISH
jgi:hypothetical protein